MWHIVKILGILLIELNIYFSLGCAMSRIKWFSALSACSWKFAAGFLAYHVLFWCAAFPCTMANASLTVLTILWTVILCTLLIIFIRFGVVKALLMSYRKLFYVFISYRVYIIPCVVLTGFLIYYVSVNGQSDIDARFYIGEVTTRLDTGCLAGIDVYTGNGVQDIGWKHAFTMIGANSAVLCKLFYIRPLIFCRTVRAAINIILLMVVSFEFFRWVYRKRECQIERSIMATMLSGAFLFLFANTIYTPSAFILHRTYEGKAYCGGALVLLVINLLIKLFETNDRGFFMLLFMCMLSSMSICASSAFLLPILAGSMVFAYVLYAHKWNYIPAFLAAIMPNIVYCAIYILKIPSFPIFN